MSAMALAARPAVEVTLPGRRRCGRWADHRMVVNGIFFRTPTGCPWRDDQILPMSAFWSVTLYDTPNFLLVANPIGRYSMGDRTSGLAYRR
jgi:hypothetical protein